MNLADRLYSLWFIVLGIAILFRADRLPDWPLYLALHVLILVTIFTLIRLRHRNRHFRFWHDWYPTLLFILAFEETARLSLVFRHHWQDHYILAFESRLFTVPPTVWLERFASPLFTELMELGYFSFYVFFVLVGGIFYYRAHRPSATDRPALDREHFQSAFRDLMSATVLGYIVCYIVYLAFPTESPARTLGQPPIAQLPGGPFHWAVNLIQHHGGVHGNAFPSGHIMSSAVTLLFALRYTRRLGLVLLPLFVLMCIGSVYDRYHYLSDVLAGALLGFIVARLHCGGPRPEPFKN